MIQLKYQLSSHIFKCMVIAVCLMSCAKKEDDDQNASTFLNELNQSRDTWESMNLTDYSYKYFAMSYDCPTDDPFPPVVISVTAGEIESVYDPQSDSYEDDNSRWPTIPDIFDKIEESLRSTSVPPESMTFNNEQGYPIEYRMDYTDAECDSTLIGVSEFSLN